MRGRRTGAICGNRCRGWISDTPRRCWTIRSATSRPQSLQNLPRGVDGDAYQWLDLDSEGLAGVLTEQRDGWYYKRNLGGVLRAGRARGDPAGHRRRSRGGGSNFSTSPATAISTSCSSTAPWQGSRNATADGGWRGFTPFRSRAEIDRRDPNLRFIDVTGDGFPDILISEDTVLTWYQSRGRAGFAPAAHTPKGWDEEKGPALVFSDPTHAIFFADMTGDGLTDIVRIRCGEVCYWPNRGYGRFGPKVTMDNAPRLRYAGSVRSATDPPCRYRRVGHRGHRLCRPRRRVALHQPVGQCLERRPPPRSVPRQRRLDRSRGGRPQGQRHRLSGVVVGARGATAAGRCAMSS